MLKDNNTPEIDPYKSLKLSSTFLIHHLRICVLYIVPSATQVLFGKRDSQFQN